MEKGSLKEKSSLKGMLERIAGPSMQALRNSFSRFSAATAQASAQAAKASAEENSAKITQSAAELLAATMRYVPQASDYAAPP